MVRPCIVIGALTGVAPLAHAGPITYLNVQQELSGDLFTTILGVGTFVDSFGFTENSPTAVNETNAISVGIPGNVPLLTLDSSYESSFGDRGFGIDTRTQLGVPDPDDFLGQLIDGSVSADLVVSVTFEVLETVEVAYTIGSDDHYAWFHSIDSDTEVDLLYDYNLDPDVSGYSGTMVLTAGTYRMISEATTEGDDFGGFLKVQSTTSSAVLSLEVIPAPGAAAWLVGGGVLMTRRRR